MLCRGIKLCFRGAGTMLLMRQSNALKTVELCFWIVRAMLSKQKAVVLWGTRAVICREESYVFKWFKAAPLIHRVRHREWRKGGTRGQGDSHFLSPPPALGWWSRLSHQVTLTILFIIGIFGVLRSNRDEEEEKTRKPESGKITVFLRHKHIKLWYYEYT